LTGNIKAGGANLEIHRRERLEHQGRWSESSPLSVSRPAMARGNRQVGCEQPTLHPYCALATGAANLYLNQINGEGFRAGEDARLGESMGEDVRLGESMGKDARLGERNWRGKR
ncbi:MAG: hypothetical protein PHI18_02450, partial [bacterium]|nr:hypothetical protein [bacterium]